MPSLSTWMRLGVLAADVEDRARALVHDVRAEPVAEDLGADVLLREREAHAAVARADHVRLLERDLERGADRWAHRVRRDGRPRGGERVVERPQELPLHLGRRRPVLHLDDRLVVDVEHEVERQAGLLAQRVGNRHEPRSGDVAEEVGAAARPGREQLRRLVSELAEDLAERLRERLLLAGEPQAAAVPDAGLLEVAQLLQVLHVAEVALEVREEHIDPAGERRHALEPTAEEREARVDERLLLRHRRRGVVVGAGVRDAAAEDPAVVVHDHRLRRGRSEIDADVALHGPVLLTPPRRRCVASGRSSGSSSPAGSSRSRRRSSGGRRDRSR